jgi:hypothetical protein
VFRDGSRTSYEIPIFFVWFIVVQFSKAMKKECEDSKAHASNVEGPAPVVVGPWSKTGKDPASSQANRPAFRHPPPIQPTTACVVSRSLVCLARHHPMTSCCRLLLAFRWPDATTLFGRGEAVDTGGCSFVRCEQCGLSSCLSPDFKS